MPPPDPRASTPPTELQADGLHPVDDESDSDLRELSDDERVASWLHTGLGFEVG